MEEEEDDDDRISSLPDEILCHILSFVETKEACATRVLSKRWKSVWQWSTSLTADFDDACYTNSEESYRLFLDYLYTAFTAIYPHKPMKKVRLCCRSSEFYDPQALSDCLYMSALRRLEHLDLSLAFPNYLISTDLSPIFRCTTLVVLKLHGFHDLQPFPNPSSVHFPLLQVLHLQDLIFPGRQSLADLLSGSPNLQDLKVTGLRFENYVTDRDFKTSPKLLRADISATHTCFLFTEVVNNVQFLRLDKIYYRLLYEPQWMYHCNSFPMFHNLIHLQLVYQRYNAHWSQVLELLHHCPQASTSCHKPAGYS